MREYEKDKIDKEIVDSLKSYELPYREGAWEDFESKFMDKDSEEAVILPLTPTPVHGKSFFSSKFWGASIAASIILLLGVFWFFNSENQVDIKNEVLVSDAGTSPAAVLETEIQENTVIENIPGDNTNIIETSTKVETPTKVENRSLNIERFEDISLYAQNASVVLSNSTIDAEIPIQNQNLWLTALNDNEFIEENNQIKTEYLGNNNWSFGMHVNSNLTTDRVNVGGGFFVSYQLTPKISIKSGVSLGSYGLNRAKSDFLGHATARLKGEDVDILAIENSPSIKHDILSGPLISGPQGPNNPGEQLAINKMPAFYHRSYIGSTSQVLTWDIPLDVHVDFNKNYYGSVGFSFIGVINEKRYNHYEEIVTSAPKSLNGEMSALQYEVEYKNIVSPGNIKPLEGNTYTGFMNFSLGRKVKVNQQFGLGFEPFVKIPVGSLKKEDMNFTHMGIKLLTHF